MPSILRSLVALAVVPIVGCGSDAVVAPEGFSHAVATRDCAPNDGAAVAILLSGTPGESLTPTAPYLRLVIWKGLDTLTARSWSVDRASSDGVALLYSTPDSYETATSGTVTIRSVAHDSTVEGTVSVTFANGQRVVGEFRARWVANNMLCG